MPRNESLKKHTLHLRDGDFDYIQSMYHSKAIGASLVIRTLVSNFVDAKRQQEAQSGEPVQVNINLED